MTNYVSYEVRPCVETRILGTSSYPSMEDAEAAARHAKMHRDWADGPFWTLYGVIGDGGGRDALLDFRSADDIATIKKLLEDVTTVDTNESQQTGPDPVTAMCIWEELLGNPARYPGYAQYREENGACAARDRVVELAEAAEVMWDEIGLDFDTSFDWEFIPMFLKYVTTCVRQSEDGMEMKVKPEGLREAARLILAHWKAEEEVSRTASRLSCL